MQVIEVTAFGDPDALHVVVEGQELVLEGVRRRPAAAGRYRQVEIEWGPFSRRISLGDDVDAEGARSTYERGILTVVLPVREAVRQSGGRVRIEVTRP